MRARNSSSGGPRKVVNRPRRHISPKLHATSTSRPIWSSTTSTDHPCSKVCRHPRDIQCEVQMLLREQSSSQCPVREVESRVAASLCCVCTTGHSVLAPLLSRPGASKQRIASSGVGIVLAMSHCLHSLVFGITVDPDRHVRIFVLHCMHCTEDHIVNHGPMFRHHFLKEVEARPILHGVTATGDTARASTFSRFAYTLLDPANSVCGTRQAAWTFPRIMIGFSDVQGGGLALQALISYEE